MRIGDAEWTRRAFQCAEDAGAFLPKPIVHLLECDEIQYDDLASGCETLSKQFPCHFKSRVRDGLNHREEE